MKPKNSQFKTCDSCGKPIAGEVKTVKLKKRIQAANYFHATPEECASAPDVKGNPTPRGATSDLILDDEWSEEVNRTERAADKENPNGR